MQLPRNVTRYKLSTGGYMYRFNPSQDLVDNRIVERKSLGTDKRKALAEAKRLNSRIDDFRAGKVAGAMPGPMTKLSQLVVAYYASAKYRALGATAQLHYEYALRDLCNATYEGRKLGDMRVKDIGVKHCNYVYQQWVERGVTSANSKRRVCSVLFNFAMKHEAIPRNPMAFVDSIKSNVRSTMWTKEQVKQFLTTAYSDFRYRSIGLIVHMAYEWCQRVGDMRTLTWDSIDLEAQRVNITQSKRGAKVALPISNGLAQMLKQQKQDFQQYTEFVTPHHRSSDNAWRCYTPQQIAALVNEVKAKAGLPSDLKAWDLRRTGITELVEAGVDILQLMMVSGHTSVQSLRPYMVNTFDGAKNALALRDTMEVEYDNTH